MREFYEAIGNLNPELCKLNGSSYFHLESHSGEPSIIGRFKAPQASKLYVLRVDIDCAGYEHEKEQARPSKDEAKKILDSLPLPYSCLVWTGGGWHAYWILKEPMVLASDGDRTEAHRLTEGWLDYIRNRCSYQLDGVADLSRIFRVPGSFNPKNGGTYSTIEYLGSERYNPADFNEYIVEKAAAPGVTTPTGKPRTAVLRHLIQEAETKAAELNVELDAGEAERMSRWAARNANYEKRPLATKDFRPTDTWNADRFVGANADTARFVSKALKWFAWDGTVWSDEADTLLEARATAMTNELWHHVAEFPDELPKDQKSGKTYRESFVAHILASQRKNKLADLVFVARSSAVIAAKMEDFDANPWILNCQNGILDLRTGVLREHNRNDLVTKVCRAAYNPDAPAPVWKRFLERVQPDREVREFLQRAIGYSLSGSVKHEAFFVLWGSGANGKSKFIGAIRNVLGDYGDTFPVSMIVKQKHEPIPESLANLRGIRFAATSEAGEEREFDEEKVKLITGGDSVKARRLYGHEIEFAPQFKIWFGTNSRPTIKSTNEAMWRRVRLIPFTVTIPDAEKDLELAEKLAGEAEGILAWAVRGAIEVEHAGRLNEPPQVLAATQDYRDNEDDVKSFVADRCVEGKAESVPMDNLFGEYFSWSEEPMSKREFGARMREKGFTTGKMTVNGKQRRTWEGISVWSGPPEPPELWHGREVPTN